jgi:beta-glucoside operon transcriptional antiterminator
MQNQCVIERIVNNNFIISVLAGKEVIIQDKGIAFNHHVGDCVELSNNARIYEPSDSSFGNYTNSLIEQVPAEIWSFTELISDFIAERIGKKLNANAFFTLLDHIFVAVDRVQKGIKLPAYLSSEVRVYYKREYEIASQVVDQMSKYFDLEFHDSERAFMTIHIVDISLDVANGTALEIEKIVDAILEIVKAFFSSEIHRDTLDYERFLNHLKYFASKVLDDTDKDGRQSEHYDVFSMLSKEWMLEMDCVNLIIRTMQEKYNYSATKDDQLYLLIHLVKITGKGRQKGGKYEI